MEKNRQIKTSSESRVIQTKRIFPDDLNNNSTMFGGSILSLMDMTASISVARHTRKASVAASMDSVNFVNPARLEDSICAESYVSGVGNSSVEVFCKVIIEDLRTGERRLCATAFTTFICFEEDGSRALVPLIEAESKEEKYIHEGYSRRRQNRMTCKKVRHCTMENVSIDIPWLTKTKDI